VSRQGREGRSRRFADLPQQEHPMLDVVMLTLGLAFFALAVGYTYACERL
jgi:hypothetical protein